MTVKLTISEIHFIKRNLEARIEWLKDNKDDPSEEEGEIRCLVNILNKIEQLNFKGTKEQENDK